MTGHRQPKKKTKRKNITEKEEPRSERAQASKGKATQPRETGPRQDKHRQTGGNQSAVIIICGLGVTLCSSKRQDHQSGLCQVLKGSRVTPPKPGLEGLGRARTRRDITRAVPRDMVPSTDRSLAPRTGPLNIVSIGTTAPSPRVRCTRMTEKALRLTKAERRA